MCETIDYSVGGNADLVFGHISRIFTLFREELRGVRELAVNIAALTESLSPFIQENTDEVCPRCRNVCCANKHAYHDYFDIVCLSALGEQLPPYKKGLDDLQPCQFMGDRGCSMKRSLRPYRCNWFFCQPLLDHMQTKPLREYRQFLDNLSMLNQNRQMIITEFRRTVPVSDTPPGTLL